MNHSSIIDLKKENEDVFTIKFNSDMEAKPGQFLMIWMPGGKEVPMSLSKVENPFSITFRVYGETTRSLSLLKEGDRIFYRGPYGNSYPQPKGKVAYVAGGTGLASLNSMIDKFEGDVYVGAKTKKDLFFLRDDFKVSTDDGSFGRKGTVVDLFLQFANDYDYIFLCGPEPMVKSLIDRIDRNIRARVFISLERLMKCGIGICDSCTINGFRVCRDGTIISLEELLKLDEFGVTRRSESGKLELVVNGKR
jgi:dihydroorotate dehydrogenase electron transfer subunit